MPLVRISLLRGKSPAYIRAIADSVHQALGETYQVPPDDRFQLIEQYEPDQMIVDPDYLGINRTQDAVIIHITASRTRDTATKSAFYKRLAELLTASPGMRPEDVMVVMAPNDRDDWSFGNGLASYVKP